MDNSYVSTPKSKSKISSGFSPVQVKESPVSPQAGNLTGHPRIVRDNAAELYNLIQEWNSNQLTGVSLLSEITNLKLSNLSEGSRNHTDDYPSGLECLIDSLNEICLKMSSIVIRMEKITKEMHSVNKLECLHHTNSTPMFLTWPPEKFCETADAIHKSYAKELKLKIHIKENVAHCFKRVDVLFHSVAWLHQPYVEDSVNIMLEAMLKETSHR